MIRAVLIGWALALAACTPAEENAALTQHLLAPTPEDVSVRITQGRNGERIEVNVNQRFAVELIGTPTAGYEWAVAQMPPFLTRAGEAGGPTTQAQNQPGFAGGNHWEVLMFAATEPGEGQLLLEQRRPWETAEPASDSFSVTIVAR